MPRYIYQVIVDAECRHDAAQVMSERLGHDEQYEDDNGVEFEYQIVDWELIDTSPIPIPKPPTRKEET